MSDQNPTVVLVHGAFAESASWNPVIQQLHAHGLDAVAVANPLRSLSGDATYVRDVIAGIGRPVVLVAHSYGGMVATQAASDNDAVAALVYVCAFAPDHGESAFTLSTRFPGSSLAEALAAYPVATGGDEFVIRPEVFHAQFCADLPPAQAALMSATQRPATAAALSEGLPAETPAWKQHPAWFVIGDQDLNIPAELQRFMAERAGAADVREVVGGSHAVATASPAPVAGAILDAVAAVTAVGAAR